MKQVKNYYTPIISSIFLLLFGQGVWGQSAGFNNTFIVLSMNGAANTYYDLNATTASPDFNTANLGTFAAGSSNLILKGAEHNVYRCGFADLTSTRLNYRIYLTASPSGSYTAQSIGYYSGFNNGCGGQDQQWSSTVLTTNLLTGLGAGAYTIEVYSDATVTNCCNGTVFASNSGNNYKATFTVATAWNGSAWSNGAPTSTIDAIIDGDLISSTDISCKNLTINSGRTLTISSANSLTVNGTLTNNGTLTIESGATLLQGPSSTITSGTTGTYNVKQTVTGSGGAGSAPTGRFWYMGVPLNSLTRGAAFGSAGTDNRLWSWSELNQQWSLQITNNNEVLSPTTGYVFRTSAPSTTLNFSGTSLYSSNVSLTGLSNSGGTFAGCHLMSNPYTAYLDWESVIAAAGTTNLSSTYCVRSYNTGSTTMVYDTYNATGDVAVNPSGVAMTRYIAPMQAFWIVVNPTTTGSISMTKSMLSHQSGAVGLKEITSFPAFARLNLVDGDFIDQVVVYTDPNAKNKIDNYDSKKFLLPNKPQVYTTVGDEQLVINGLKSGMAKTIVPLTVELPNAQVYTFEMNESYVENGSVILEDTQEGVFQDMGIHTTYQFSSDAGVIANRFVLHFLLPTGNTSDSEDSQVGINDLTNAQIDVINNQQGSILVSISSDLQASGEIQILDAAGSLIQSKTISDHTTALAIKQGAGIYFVRVITPLKSEMKKIFIY